MNSNNELMILSLLNLYTSYINLKRKNASDSDNKPSHNRYATKQLQAFKSLNKQGQTFNKSADVSTKAENPIQKDRYFYKVAPVTDSAPAKSANTCGKMFGKACKEMEIPLYGCNNAPHGSSNRIGVAAMADAAQGNENLIIKNAKRRRRGAKNLSEDGTKRKRIKRRWRVRPVNRDRAITGYHRKVFANIKKMDQQQFFEHTRMSKSLFDWLLTFVQTSLRKKKQSILPEERLSITLNYLAYGTSLQSIAWKHKIGKSTARQIVLDTCSVLWSLLSPIYLNELTTSQYADIAKDFRNKWDVPNCVGSVAGKHVAIRDPSKSAPVNNKVFLTIPILGICDAKYKFLAVSVGHISDRSEGGVFQLSTQNNIIISENLPLPTSKPIYPSTAPFPYFFISDTSFPLRKNNMRPYTESNLDATKTIFNYKISRALAVTENTFGILTARFRVLLTTIEFLPDNCKTIILACIVLHNFIMMNDDEKLYCPSNFIDRVGENGVIEDGEWRKELRNNGDQPLPTMPPTDSRSTFEANSLRNTLASLFASEAVSYEIQIV